MNAGDNVINVAYPLLAFSDLKCHLDNTGMSFGCTVPLDSKGTELGSNKEASPSVRKNTRIVLVPC